MLTNSNQIFRIDVVIIHYHLVEISCQIIEFIFFGPYELSITNSPATTIESGSL